MQQKEQIITISAPASFFRTLISEVCYSANVLDYDARVNEDLDNRAFGETSGFTLMKYAHAQTMDDMFAQLSNLCFDAGLKY